MQEYQDPFKFKPPVTPEEVRYASLQFVRKISGYSKPSKANEAAFFGAVEDIANVSARLLESLETNALPKNRAKAKCWGRLKAFIGSELFVWALAARTLRAHRQALGVRYLAVL